MGKDDKPSTVAIFSAVVFNCIFSITVFIIFISLLEDDYRISHNLPQIQQ